MILVTGATGGLGGATLDALFKRTPANQIAGLAREPGKAKIFTAKGIEIRSGDYLDSHALVNAFKGIDKLLLVSAVAFIDGFTQHKNVIDAAKQAGVEHVFYTSTQRNDAIAVDIPWVSESSLETEKYLESSGLEYTIIRNTFYFENLPYWIGNEWPETGVAISAGEGKVPFAARTDLAEANAILLLQKGHAGKTYTLTNSRLYSFADIAAILAGLLGKPVPYKNITPEFFIERMKKAGFPEPVAIFWAQWAEAFHQGYMTEVDNTLEKLLGRKPVGAKEFLKGFYFS